MGLALDDNGNILYNSETGLVKEKYGNELLVQNAMCELRCEQNEYSIEESYGRNPLVWKLPTGVQDKLVDTKRVVEKHITVKSIEFKDERILIEV